MARTIFDEIDDTSLVQTGVPRLATNYLFRGDNGQAEPHSATIAKRFGGVLDMFSSLEVKVLYST